MTMAVLVAGALGGFGSVPAVAGDPVTFAARLERLFTERVESRYFVYHSNLPRTMVTGYAAFSDAFVDEVNRRFFAVENRFPIRAVLLPDKAAFAAFVTSELGERDSPGFGLYRGDLNVFVSYHGSGLGTFTHEILHPLVAESLRGCPRWGWEGIPAFAEKFFAHTERGRMEFVWGFQNPWRIRELGERLPRLDLRTIVQHSSNTSEHRLVAIFLFEQGRWKTFLDHVKRHDRRGQETFVEAAMGMSFAQMEPLWRQYLERVASQREQIARIPQSAVFPTEREMREYMRRHGLP
jgi:hypothetical protein